MSLRASICAGVDANTTRANLFLFVTLAAIDGKDIIYHDFVNISVAVAGPKGLVTPVIRGCEVKSIAEIERALGEAAQKARDGMLAMEDFDGGTITISNGGVCVCACGRNCICALAISSIFIPLSLSLSVVRSTSPGILCAPSPGFRICHPSNS
jgi:pyruvate/2-oxoglutarate dehydrogenase complex dihydrolipoamide acyltransferase (E2) component